MANSRDTRSGPTSSAERRSPQTVKTGAGAASAAGDGAGPTADASRVMQLVDPNNVAEVFASEAAIVDAESGIVTTTYVVHRVLGQSGANPMRKNVVVGRIAMPITAAYALRGKLDRILSAYEAMKAPPPPGKSN
jgi:hypothetical protein